MAVINPFADPIQVVAGQIFARATNAGKALRAAYKLAQDDIHAHPVYTAEQIISALGADKYAALQMFAVAAKAATNFIAPGSIVDTVPEATVTLPS